LDRCPRNAQVLCQRHHRHPGVVAQQRNQLLVDIVEISHIPTDMKPAAPLSTARIGIKSVVAVILLLSPAKLQPLLAFCWLEERE
jgi:hypothetical protein